MASSGHGERADTAPRTGQDRIIAERKASGKPSGGPSAHAARRTMKISREKEMSAGINNSVRVTVAAACLAISGVSLSATAAAAPQSMVNSAAKAQEQSAPAAGQENWAWD